MSTTLADAEAQVNFKAGETRFGKDIEIRRRPQGKFVIVVRGGGIQPPEFEGIWGWIEANHAVQGYLDRIAGDKSVETVAEELGVKPEALAEVLEQPAQESAQEKKTLSLKRK
ncbi:MAG: hypothetical protein RBS78_00980 [Coriobacteriia bacterium]|jgi:hypothetical protein|nr:hypothetical protein [Coriobacteriia bacterium]